MTTSVFLVPYRFIGYFSWQFLFLFSLAYSANAVLSDAQQAKVDSLNAIIREAPHDTSVARAYLALTEILYVSNLDTVIPLSEKALASAEAGLANNEDREKTTAGQKIRKSLLLTMAGAINNMGFIYGNRGEVQNALDAYLRSLELQREIGDKAGMATSLNNIGYVYKKQGNIQKALDYYHRSLKIKEEMGNKVGIGTTLNNIALIYRDQGDLDKALDYGFRALKLRETGGDKNMIANSYNNIGQFYDNKGDVEQALVYYDKALTLQKEIGNQRAIANSYNNIGVTYKSKGDLDSSLLYYTSALRMWEKVDYKFGIASALLNIGHVYWSKNDLTAARSHGLRSITIAREMGYPGKISNAANFLSRISKFHGRYKESLEWYELHIQMRDSILNEENAKATIKQQMKYEFEKKEALLQAEKEKQELAHREKVKRQELIIFSVGGGLFLVIVFSIFLFNRFKVTQRQKDVIVEQKKVVDEKNKHITDSIKYAQKIQEAILPGEESWSKAFGSNGEKHFVMFKPKDVVSGDFYWIHVTPNDQVIWAAADCTGHGVPGAFMSMIGTSLLNEIVIEKGITQSNEILDQLRESIKKALGHSDASDSRKDGLDIALCVWDRSTNTLQYSGAYNPLFLIRNNATEADVSAETSFTTYQNDRCVLMEVKADRQPIGIYINEKPFGYQNIPLKSGDTLYTFSDGFIDQFGGPEGRKFSVRQFREAILNIQQQPMPVQQELLSRQLDSWKKDKDQLDDICVIGVKV